MNDSNQSISRVEDINDWINKVHLGSCFDLIKQLPDESVDMIVTSPPYFNLRNYNVEGQFGQEKTFEEFVEKLCELFKDARRVLKKSGSVWVNLGDCYSSSGEAGSGEDEGGETGISWVKHQRRAGKSRLPEKCLNMIPQRFAIKMIDDVGYILRNEIVWFKRNCLSSGTLLYAKTQKGVMPANIRDLSRLDPKTVSLWDGEKWQQVKKWVRNTSPKNIKQITFRNGENIICTGDHLFPLNDGGLKKAEELKRGHIIKNTILPNNDETNNSSLIPDEIGWFIGLYLAEGSRGGRKHEVIQISGHKKETERLKKCQKIAEMYHGHCNHYFSGENGMNIHIHSKILNALIDTYIGGRTAHDKRLSNECWQRSNKFLESLLKSYLDGDGHFDKNNNRYRIGFTRNEFLANDLRLICARLGYHVRLKRATSTCNGEIFKIYRGEIRLTKTKHFNNKSDYEIIKINKYKNVGDFWDIVLKDEPHLFSSHSGLLIHNCMPSSVSSRFTVDWEPIFFFVKDGDEYYFEQQFEPMMTQHKKFMPPFGGTKDTGNATYSGKKVEPNPLGRTKRCVWDIPTQASTVKHAAMFNEKLIETPILASCPEFICTKCGKPREKIFNSGEVVSKGGSDTGKMSQNKEAYVGAETKTKSMEHREKLFSGEYSDCGCGAPFRPGVVLDPFMGSGTSGLVARKLGRNFIGFELNPEFQKIANDRINDELGLFA